MLIRSRWLAVFNIYVGFCFVIGWWSLYHYEMSFLMFRNAHCLKSILWVLRQDDGVEGFELTSSQENIKITIICWRTTDKKDWNLPKKGILHPKTKKQPQWDSRRDLWYNQILLSFRWVTHKLENNCITEVLSQELEFWAPIRLPRLGVWHQVEEPSEHLALKVSGAWSRELYRTRGNRKATLGGHTQTRVHGTQGESGDFLGAWARATQWSWRDSGRRGRVPLRLIVGTRTLVAEVPPTACRL